MPHRYLCQQYAFKETFMVGNASSSLELFGSEFDKIAGERCPRRHKKH